VNKLYFLLLKLYNVVLALLPCRRDDYSVQDKNQVKRKSLHNRIREDHTFEAQVIHTNKKFKTPSSNIYYQYSMIKPEDTSAIY